MTYFDESVMYGRMTRLNNSEKTILYYPTIKIQDGQWLRNAILYWDNVASIVPGVNYDECNSPEIEYLHDAGIYKAIYPSALGFDEDLCTRFCREVKTKLRQNKNWNRSEEFSPIHKEKIALGQRAMLHINKTPPSILDFLKDEGIVMENCDGPWINMKTKDAEIYMAILAKYLAKIEGNTDIGTDIYRKFFYPHVKVNRINQIEKQLYLDMALQQILPAPNMDGISIESIIDFRISHGQELRFFRRRIESFQENLKWQTGDVEELLEKTVRFKNEISQDIQQIDELLKSKTISFKRTCLRTLLPIGLNAGIGFFTAKGYLTGVQTIYAEALINFAIRLFDDKESQGINLSENNTYLFYAKKNRMI